MTVGRAGGLTWAARRPQTGPLEATVGRDRTEAMMIGALAILLIAQLLLVWQGVARP